MKWPRNIRATGVGVASPRTHFEPTYFSYTFWSSSTNFFQGPSYSETFIQRSSSKRVILGEFSMMLVRSWEYSCWSSATWDTFTLSNASDSVTRLICNALQRSTVTANTNTKKYRQANTLFTRTIGQSKRWYQEIHWYQEIMYTHLFWSKDFFLCWCISTKYLNTKSFPGPYSWSPSQQLAGKRVDSLALFPLVKFVRQMRKIHMCSIPYIQLLHHDKKNKA